MISKFTQTKTLFKQTIQAILKTQNSYAIDEAALPAYAHRNPLIDFIFWQRIKTAYNFAIEKQPKKVLDFGCGTGVLSYLLSNENIEVTANDLTFAPLNLVKEKIVFPSTIQFIEGDLIKITLPEKSFDCIFALDVLEHIENLEEYIELFRRLLKPNGVMVVSGPTENILYKIGRKLAGSKFTGDYHVTDINKIKSQFSKVMQVKTIKKIMPPITLFEIFIAYENTIQK